MLKNNIELDVKVKCIEGITTSEFAIATVGGSIGGIMADIDVKIDTSNKFAVKA